MVVESSDKRLEGPKQQEAIGGGQTSFDFANMNLPNASVCQVPRWRSE